MATQTLTRDERRQLANILRMYLGRNENEFDEDYTRRARIVLDNFIAAGTPQDSDDQNFLKELIFFACE